MLKFTIENIRKDPDRYIADIYRSYRSEFVLWARRKYHSDEETLLDSFQDAVIVLYSQIRRNESLQLASGLKTYLFAVGKNILLNKLRKIRPELPLDENLQGVQNYTVEEELYEGNPMENKIAALVEEMKEPCRSILKYYYYDNLSMDSIAGAMGYKNSDTVKAQKSRCIKYLKDAVYNDQIKSDFQ